jgi:ethanolamine permease
VITIWEFAVVICAYAQSPGYLDDYIGDYLPLNSGFSNALGISDHMATIISLPALYISNAIYIFGYGKQMSALAHSKLLPSMLGWTLPHSKIPYVSLIVGSLFGMVVLVILVKGYGYTYFSSAINNCFNSALMGSYFTFMVMFVSFIIFRRKYPNLKRGYTNPLGLYGAIYGIISLSFMFAALIGWSNDDYGAVKYFACFIGICSVYYFGYAKYRQIYSEEEQNILFVVYLIKGTCVVFLFYVVKVVLFFFPYFLS